ncbi:hypothetical protein DFH06DRAFT_1131936 [Mycena polygramma]|nr:hypothetical protein DFH06DRAFT_1131936 [Mycena polygramma]
MLVRPLPSRKDRNGIAFYSNSGAATLSRPPHSSWHLYLVLIKNFRDFQVCASVFLAHQVKSGFQDESECPSLRARPVDRSLSAIGDRRVSENGSAQIGGKRRQSSRGPPSSIILTSTRQPQRIAVSIAEAPGTLFPAIGDRRVAGDGSAQTGVKRRRSLDEAVSQNTGKYSCSSGPSSTTGSPHTQRTCDPEIPPMLVSLREAYGRKALRSNSPDSDSAYVQRIPSPGLVSPAMLFVPLRWTSRSPTPAEAPPDARDCRGAAISHPTELERKVLWANQPARHAHRLRLPLHLIVVAHLRSPVTSAPVGGPFPQLFLSVAVVADVLDTSAAAASLAAHHIRVDGAMQREGAWLDSGQRQALRGSM